MSFALCNKVIFDRRWKKIDFKNIFGIKLFNQNSKS